MKGWITVGIVVCWILFTMVWGLLLLYEWTKGPRKKKASEWSYYGGLYVTGGVSALCYALEVGSILSFQPIVGVVGLLVTIGGLVLATWGRFILDGAWTLHAAIKEDFVLVTHFPYSILRHPIYAGQLLMCLGTSLVSHNVCVLGALFGGTFVHHYWRSVKEESVLDRFTNGGYLRQFVNKGRFIPTLRRGTREERRPGSSVVRVGRSVVKK